MRLNFTVYLFVQNKEIVYETVLAVLKKQRKAEGYYRAFKIGSVIPKQLSWIAAYITKLFRYDLVPKVKGLVLSQNEYLVGLSNGSNTAG